MLSHDETPSSDRPRKPYTIVHVLDPATPAELAAHRQRSRATGTPCTDATVLCCASAIRKMRTIDPSVQHEIVVVGSMATEKRIASLGLGTENRLNRSVLARSLVRFLRDRFDQSSDCVVCCWSSATLYAIAENLPDVRAVCVTLDDPGLIRESPIAHLDPPPPGVRAPDALPSCGSILKELGSAGFQSRTEAKLQWRDEHDVPANACVLGLLGSHAVSEPPFQFSMLLGRLEECSVRVVGTGRLAPEPLSRVRRFARVSAAEWSVINIPGWTIVDQLSVADIAIALHCQGAVPVTHEVSIALGMGVPVVTGRSAVPVSILPDVHRERAVALADDPSALARPLLKLIDDPSLREPLVHAGMTHDVDRDTRFAQRVLDLAQPVASSANALHSLAR